MTNFRKNNNTDDTLCDTSRRKLLKGTATVAGIAAIAPAISFANGASSEDMNVVKSAEEIRSEYHRYITSVLKKYAAKSKRIKPEYIDGFAKGFIELNGDINYEQTFKGLTGEYRLVKLFIRSVNSSRLPA